ncbi:cilia- and flagella-associated protein 221 isoform X2 [Engystomops pustulosus]|uniref:cilia- and flagella-associated protein 221 isoform X2 n=1 Tax=Engystomops pustulosus TaxID=76066 RepID=UPI003AFB1C52
MEVATFANYNISKQKKVLFPSPAAPPSSSAPLNSFVEKDVRAVPNHLLESRVYMTLGSNVSIAADPGTLHFAAFEVGKCHHRTLRLVNLSSEVSGVHIIPPQSPYFTINYRKASRLAPGLALQVDVQFVADEWRYYYDCIRIHCKGEETLLVPLHAFPSMELLHFPSHITLSDVALGQSAHYILQLRSTCPVDFEFCIICSQPHKDFEIWPTSGMVPGAGEVDVTVTYTPSSYGTAQITLELLISEFNAKPRLCVVSGTCSPKWTVKKEQPKDVQVPPKRRPQGSQRPSFEGSRKKRQLQSLQQNACQVTEFQNLRSPINLSNPHAVSTVLNQKLEERRVRDLHPGSEKVQTRQEKETWLQQVIQRDVAEEEANQLRWQVHLGHDPMSAEQRDKIRQERQSAEAKYQETSGPPDLAAECRRETALAGWQRVLRCADEGPRTQPQFDLYLNDLWANRNRVLRRFQQASRTVLIRGRVDRRLRILRTSQQGNRASESGQDEVAPISARQEEVAPISTRQEEVAPLSAQLVHFYEFPPSVTETNDLMLQDLVSSPPRPPATSLRVQLSFQDLRVPQHFRLMGYETVRSRVVSSVYQSCHLARPLRRGAEDELIAEMPNAHTAPQSQEQSIRREAEGQGLRPPETLLNPPDFHPMHVFNPAPGIVAFKRSLPYSEIDLNHHLCPLSKYPGRQEGAGGVDRKEIIRGFMTWKKFPAASLCVPLSGSRDSTTRWCDPFSLDLLPQSAPPALNDLPAKDKENVAPRDGDDTEAKVRLTLDMLRAEFPTLEIGAAFEKLSEVTTAEQEDKMGDILCILY